MPAGQAPGANSRGRGGKFRKFTRGGGKHFSRDLRPVDADGNEVSMWAEREEGSGSEEESEDESEEESEEEAPAAAAGGLPGVESREDRKKEKKARKEAAIARSRGQAVQVGDMPESEDESEEDDLPANPNHSAAGRNQTRLGQSGGAGRGGVNAADDKLKGLSLGNDESESDEGDSAGAASKAPQSRRERESLEAQQSKERYRKLHEQGKTDEAKADLARLKIIREKREAEAARKQAEKEEREAQEKTRRDEIEAREAKKREAALGRSSKKGKK